MRNLDRMEGGQKTGCLGESGREEDFTMEESCEKKNRTSRGYIETREFSKKCIRGNDGGGTIRREAKGSIYGTSEEGCRSNIL
ncbi:hypothetical protein J437_LFUL019680 [Ladona fulva]|nr:hypothetical protein J437_LFUL019680 [Ladona fulva]